MMHKMFKLSLIRFYPDLTARLSWLLALMLLASCSQTPPADRLLEGRPFPTVQLTGLDRDDAAVADFRGRVVVLNVWASWCGPCLYELPSLQRLSEQLDPQHFAVITLSVDNDQLLAREFLLEQKITLANYIDPQQRIANDVLAVRVYPDTFIISPNGTLWRSIAGEREWDSVAVMEALESALRGDLEALMRL